MNSYLVPSLYWVNNLINFQDMRLSSPGEPTSYWRGFKIASAFSFAFDICNGAHALHGVGLSVFKITQIALQIGIIGLILAEAQQKGWKKEYVIRALCSMITSLRLFCELPDKFCFVYLLPSISPA